MFLIFSGRGKNIKVLFPTKILACGRLNIMAAQLLSPGFPFQGKNISSTMLALLGAVFLLLYPSAVRTSDLMGFKKQFTGIPIYC